MAIRNTDLGGTDWVDNEVLYNYDLNDTFDEAASRIADNVTAIALRGLVEVGQADVNGTSGTISSISETYDLYLLTFSLAYSSGGTSGTDRLQLTLNGDTGANYDYIELDAGAIGSVNNASAFDLAATIDTSTNYAGAVWIGVQNGTSKYLNVSPCSPVANTQVFLGGILDSAGSQLTQTTLTFAAARTYVGHMKIYGVDLT